mgnify:CR=1 FL=1
MIEAIENNKDYKWLNKIYKPQLRSFHNAIMNYCKTLNIRNSFESYLNQGDGYVSDTYESLFIAPKYYLVNSAAFWNYYLKLDKDFQDDIMTYEEYKNIQGMLRLNVDLVSFLQKLMGDDSIL